MTLKKLGIRKTNVIYPSLKKMIYKIKGFWNNDPELLNKYENIFRQKEEEKEENGTTKRRIKPIGSQTPPNLASNNNM